MADLLPGEPGTSLNWAEVFAHAAWGIRIGSADGRLVEAVNPEFARMHGYGVDEMRQMPVEALFPPECREAIPGHWQRAIEKGHHDFESWHLRKDGSRFPVLVQFSAVKDAEGRIKAQAVNVLDLTKWHEADAARAASDERYRVIADAASDAIITIDAKSRILVVNLAVERIFGYRPDELTGQSLTMLMPEYLRHVHEAGLGRYDDRTGVPFSRENALSFDELRGRFKATQEPLLRTINGMSPEAMASRPPRNLTGDPNETVGSNLATFVFHECYHVGQTGVLRWVAGKPGVIKPPGR